MRALAAILVLSALEAQAGWIGESGLAGARLGAGGAEGAGDVNGDGYADLIGGARGSAYLWLGRPAGPAALPDWVFSPCAGCGGNVASVGDVDGDGYDDILVGASNYAANQIGGRVFLFLGSAGGLSGTPDWTFDGGQAHASLGGDVSGAGDLNGDGYDDFAVTASGFDNGQTDEGRAFVFFGSPSGPRSRADWTWEPDLAQAGLSQATAAGDVDGDGFSDLLLLAWDSFSGGVERVFLFLGADHGPGSVPACTRERSRSATASTTTAICSSTKTLPMTPPTRTATGAPTSATIA